MSGLVHLYWTLGGGSWSRQRNWFVGEPCVDGWEGVTCCPEEMPIYQQGVGCRPLVSEERRLEEGEGELIRDDVAFTPLHAEPNRTYPEGCASPHKTGTPIDAARCVVVDIDLNSNNLTGTLNVTEIVAREAPRIFECVYGAYEILMHAALPAGVVPSFACEPPLKPRTSRRLRLHSLGAERRRAVAGSPAADCWTMSHAD